MVFSFSFSLSLVSFARFSFIWAMCARFSSGHVHTEHHPLFSYINFPSTSTADVCKNLSYDLAISASSQSKGSKALYFEVMRQSTSLTYSALTDFGVKITSIKAALFVCKH